MSDTPPGPIDVRFYLFLNEEVIPLGLNGLNYRDIHLEPDQAESISVELPPLTDGMYDLVIAGIPNIYSEPVGFAGSGEAPNISLFVRRSSLVVGDVIDADELDRPYEPVKALHYFTDEQRNNLDQTYPISQTLIPTLSERSYWWVWPDISLTVEENATYQFNLLTQYQYYGVQDERYANGKELGFSILGFQNYLPIPLGNNTDVLYGKMTDEVAQAAVPVTIQAPSVEGRYDLVFFKIDYPGFPLCRFTRLSEGVEGIRISIQVEDE